MTPRLRQVIFTSAAFLAAPFVAALGIVLAGSFQNSSESMPSLDFVFWTCIFYIYAAMATVLLGLPSFLILRKLGAIRWWSASLVGAIVGILYLALISNPPSLSKLSTDPWVTVLWGGVGALSAFVFWVIREWGRHGS